MGQVKQFTCKIEWLGAFRRQLGAGKEGGDIFASEESFVRNK